MLRHALLSSILLASTLYTTTASANIFDKQSHHFINERGSTMTVTALPKTETAGEITGTFSTAVASQHCQDLIGKPVPITGYYSGNALTITVSYPTCGSVVAMVGNVDQHDVIHTIWLVAHGGQGEAEQWNTRMVGSDTFKVLTTDKQKP